MQSDMLTAEALKLSPYERAQIAEAIMHSLMDEAQARRDAAWAVWADQQAALASAGKLETVNGPAFLASLRQPRP